MIREGSSQSGQLGTAWFSDDMRYRYYLSRWPLKGSSSRRLNVIGLNPSTADTTRNDPTIRRCIGFAETWGFGKLSMTNLFGFRATDPRQLKFAGVDAIGPENDKILIQTAEDSDMVLAAWSGFAPNRAVVVRRMLEAAGIELYCLGTTKAGQPRHPLYQRADTQPSLLPYWP